jgi:solute carrier family 25 (mitochondrial carrier protein), member 16
VTKEMKKTTKEYAMKSMVAGGIAGSLAKTVVAPLDRVKILFQTFHSGYIRYHGSFLGFFNALEGIRKVDGMKGLFRGHSVTLLRVFPYAGIKFAVYEQVRTDMGEFIAGSVAGVFAVLVTYPFDFIRVRMAYDDKAVSLPGMIKRVFNEPIQHRFRIFNFYRGVVPTIVGMVPYAGVSFYTYDSLKKWTSQFPIFQNQSPPPRLNSMGTLLSGALSGMVAQTVSYPFEVIRRQMQVNTRLGMHATIGGTFRDIVQKRGYRGLFVGLSIGYIKVAPLFATSFYSYEYLKRAFGIE